MGLLVYLPRQTIKRGGNTMSIYQKGGLIITAILLSLNLTACGKKDGEGTAERAGKQIDKAVDSVKETAKEAADKAGTVASDATKKVKEAAKDATSK
jgi:hypothetical protein